ncbi:MAG: hypothetical protein AB7N71_01000, partial [Phycisphaerae bacterium]
YLLSVSVLGQSGSPATWSPQAQEALRRLESQDFHAAIAIARQLGNTSASPLVRAECEAVEVLVALRGSDRQRLLDARVQLRSLATDVAGLLERAECQLGLGIAGVALSETAGAIVFLEEAAAAFAEAGKFDLQAEALAALAEAWSVHGEWEITSSKYLDRRPRTPEESAAQRVAQIESILQRLPSGVGTSLAADRIDLSLARALEPLPGKANQQIDLLARLAAGPIRTPIAAEAGNMLAGVLRRDGQGQKALEVLEAVAASGVAPYSNAARALLRDAKQAPLGVTLSESANDPGLHEVTIHSEVPTTGMAEIRRVDLEDWLRQCQGRVAFETLPVTGSFITSHEFSFAEPAEDSNAGREISFTARLTPGAYVVALYTEASRPAPITQKHLHIVDPIPAAALIGTEAGIFWTVPRAAEASVPDASGLFWMHGSFVPRSFTLAGGIGSLVIPPDAKILVDSRWVCLLRQGERLALLQGELDRSRTIAATRTRALLLAGPARPRIGEDVYVAGILVNETGQIETAFEGQEAELSLRDDAERALVQQKAVIQNGMVRAKFKLLPEAGSAPLRVRVRVGKEIIPNHEASRVVLSPRRDIELIGAIDAKRVLEPNAAEMQFSLRAWYPWGVTCNELPCEVGLSAIGMPTSQRPTWQEFAPYSHPKILDETGEMSAAVSLESFPYRTNPQLLSLSVFGSDASFSSLHSYHPALRGEGSTHVWLATKPTIGLVGMPTEFWAGWASATRTTQRALPTIEISGPDDYSASIPARVLGRMSFPEWVPPKAGTYQARLQVPMTSGTLETEATIRVEKEPAKAENAGGERPKTTAIRTQSGIEVHLPAKIAEPMLLIAADAEPRSGQWVMPEQTPGTILLRSDSADAVSTILSLSGSEHGAALVDRTPVRAAGTPVAGPENIEIVDEFTRTEDGYGRITFSVAAQHARRPVLCWLEKAGGYAASALRRREMSENISSSGKLEFRFSASFEHAGEGNPAMETIAIAEQPSPLTEVATSQQVLLWTDFVVPDPDHPTLVVPFSAGADYYRCWFAQAGPEGIRLQNLLIDCTEIPEIKLDFPPIASAGDRSILTIAIRNDEKFAREFRVDAPTGNGVHFVGFLNESGQILAREQVKSAQVAAGSVQFVPVAMEIEPGTEEGFVSATVHEGELSSTVRHPFVCRSESTAKDSQATKIEIRRSIRRAERQVEHFDEITGEPREGGQTVEYWSAVPADFDDSFASGQILVVREMVMVSEALRGVRWHQRIPSNCSYVEPPPDAIGSFQTIGPIRDMRPESITIQIQELGPGTYVHEYWIRAGRGGSGLFPQPEVTASQGAARIQMLPIAPFITTYVP